MTLLQNFSTILENPVYLAPVLIWSVIWKGVALWKCGRNNQIKWFIALLVINTVGILEIIYLTWFQKKGNKKSR